MRNPSVSLPTTTRSRVVHFTPAKLKAIADAQDGKYYTDQKVPSLTVRAAKSLEMTFTVSMDVHGKREFEQLGIYMPADLTVTLLNTIRDNALAQKRKWREQGVEKKTDKTLDDLIDYYTSERLAGNIDAKKEDGMPKDWDEQCVKMRAIYKKILNKNITAITVDDLKQAKKDHLQELADNKPVPENSLVTIIADPSVVATQGPAAVVTKPAKPVLNDRPLRRPFSAMRQVLTCAINEGWQQPRILSALKTRKYKSRPRFLLPGEWQRLAVALNELPHDGGLFIRFLLTTGARLSCALTMRWDQLDPRVIPIEDPRGEFGDKPHPVMMWRTKVKGDRAGLIHLVGEPLRIIEHFDRQREASADPNRETVFPIEVITMWRNKGSHYQRCLEVMCGLAPFTRHDLRRTLATYLKYAKSSQSLVSVALTHTLGPRKGGGDQEAASATAHYTKDEDAFSDCLGDKEDLNQIDTGDLFEVARAHLRVQALFTSMEKGERTALLKRIETPLQMGPRTNDMMSSRGVAMSLVFIDAPEFMKRWAEARAFIGWAAVLQAKHRYMRNASKRKQNAKKSRKQQMKMVHARNSGSAVAIMNA